MKAEDDVQSQIQPQFPPSYIPENRRAIDWGHNGLIAYASGACVHLSHTQNTKLVHVGSIEVAPYTVSCIRFHPTLRTIAIGDVCGRLFLWEIDFRRYIASAKPLKSRNDKIMALQWKDDVLLVLLSSKKLVGVVFDKKYSMDDLKYFRIIWEINLPREFTSFSLEPNFGKRILFHGFENIFSIYQYDNINEEPKSLLEEVSLNEKSNIKDAQWSLHLPGYIFIVVERDLMYFNIESSSLIPLIDKKLVRSGFSFIVQFPADHTKLLTIHRNSVISLYEITSNYIYSLTREFQSKFAKGVPVTAAVCPFNDNHLTIFYNNIGLAFFDLKSMRITSIDPTFPSDVTAYDSDGTQYVIGTKNGYVILGNLFDTNDQKRFYVSSEQITFISYDAPALRVYWQTIKDLGIIDLATRTIERFKSHANKSTRCFGSHFGALLVQHDDNVLGIFIEGKERPLLLKDKIIDVSIDINSNQCQGKFYVLLSNNSIMFYSYNENGILSNGGVRPRVIDFDPLCLTTLEDDFVTGFSDGSLSFYNSRTKASKKVHLNVTGLRSLQFGKNSNIVFGLCQGTFLFKYEGKDINVCPFHVRNFKVVSDSLLLVLADDGIVKFIRISDWMQLSYVSNYAPAPSEDQILKYFIENRKENDYYTPIARDAWIFLNEMPMNMRLHSVLCTGKVGEFDRIHYEYLSRIDSNVYKIKVLRFNTLIFLGKFEEAADLIFEPDSNKNNFLTNSLLSTLLLLVSNGLTEKARIQLKAISMSLFSQQKYDEGSVLMKAANYDKDAAIYLLENNKFEYAIKFIRNIENKEEHKELLLIYGIKLYKLGRLDDSIPLFAAAEQYHPVLYILFTLGLIPDAYFLYKKLQELNLLAPLQEQYHSMIPELTNLQDLCDIIKQQFSFVLTRLEIDVDNYFN